MAGEFVGSMELLRQSITCDVIIYKQTGYVKMCEACGFRHWALGVRH